MAAGPAPIRHTAASTTEATLPPTSHGMPAWPRNAEANPPFGRAYGWVTTTRAIIVLDAHHTPASSNGAGRSATRAAQRASSVTPPIATPYAPISGPAMTA